jgi:DNA-binding transcriptional ArsR family regulator
MFNRMVERHTDLDAVFGALADPTRRAILATLAGGDANVGALAEQFPISLNGVSKHVRVLEQAGLIARDVQGREHYLKLDAKPLGDAAAWLVRYRAFWNTRLDSLERFVVARKHRKRKR